MRREERQKSSVYTTAETILEAFADPAVAASADTSDIDPEALLDGTARTLYVCAPSHEQARLRPLFTALLQQVIAAAYERAADGALLERPLLIVLDEAANIAPLPDLDTLASTAAGIGIQLVTVWQDMAQIHNRYSERATTIVNNHRAKLALSGISDPRTLEYFSRLVGDTEITRASTTHDDTGKTSTTQATHHRRLAPTKPSGNFPAATGSSSTATSLPCSSTSGPGTSSGASANPPPAPRAAHGEDPNRRRAMAATDDRARRRVPALTHRRGRLLLPHRGPSRPRVCRRRAGRAAENPAPAAAPVPPGAGHSTRPGAVQRMAT